MKPEVALVTCAIWTEHWLAMYEEFTAKSTVPFCFIFVGNVRPSYPLPDNIIYVYSEMVPSACAEAGWVIAYSMPSLKHIMHVADDSYMFSDRFLDFSVEVYEQEKEKNPLLVVGPGYSVTDENGRILMAYDHSQMDHPLNPILPVYALFSVETAKAVGGADKRFKFVMWDLDRIMRLHQMGGKVIIKNEIVCVERPPDGRISPSRPLALPDHKLLFDLWRYEDQSFRTERKDAVQPYSEDELEYVIESGHELLI